MKKSFYTNKHVTPEHVLEALVESKRLMDEYNYLSSYFLSIFSSWNYLRVFLVNKEIIKPRHTTYIWIGQKPNEELAKEYNFTEHEIKELYDTYIIKLSYINKVKLLFLYLHKNNNTVLHG